MKKVIATLFALILLAATPAMSFNWSGVVARLAKSTVQLQTPLQEGFCSGWVSDNRPTRDFVFTAEHCVNSDWVKDGEIFIDNLPASVIWSDTNMDVAVLQVGGIDRPELRPGKHPRVGQEMGSYGFAYGFKSPLFRAGHVSAVDYHIPDLPGDWVITDQTFIGGMSGGPVVNGDGKVIAMVQRGNTYIGLGHSIKEIYS